MTLTEMFTICDSCVYAPCLCGNDPENCVAYVMRTSDNGSARERTARMAKQSGMIAFAEQFAQAKVEAAQRLISQYMTDTLQMTLHQTEGWGYERIMRLTEAWQQTQKEYTPALNSNDPAADVRQEHMDRVLAQIINGKAKLIPFPDRYLDLKKIKYRR